MLNNYLGAMIQIIEEYRGTIDEFIGDAIFVLFGAPIRKEDDAQRAVACAVAMQLAMAEVNKHNLENGLPELEMGIGIHTGQVVVGNIGSAKRMKYGVIGGHVNLVLAHSILHDRRADSHLAGHARGGRHDLHRRPAMELKAKGVEQLVAVFEVLGIDG